MKVVFFGSGAFGLPTLERLARECDLLAVVTQPDRPAGRSKHPTPTPIGFWAESCLSPERIYKPESVNEASVRDRLRSIDADAWVVIAFGQKLGRPLLEDRFAVNLHASLLPRWRGAAPINHAILAGDTETGNSVITLVDRMDAGLVLGRSKRTIDPLQTAGELHDALASDGPDLVMGVLAQHEARTLVPETQDESRVTLAGKLSKADGWIDFADQAEVCRRRIHGLTPWPSVPVELAGVNLKLLRAKVASPSPEQVSAPHGLLVDPARGLVACGQGSLLELLKVQPAGGRAMGWDAYDRGRRPPANEILIPLGSKPC